MMRRRGQWPAFLEADASLIASSTRRQCAG
jgi:hypothetical protein